MSGIMAENERLAVLETKVDALIQGVNDLKNQQKELVRHREQSMGVMNVLKFIGFGGLAAASVALWRSFTS